MTKTDEKRLMAIIFPEKTENQGLWEQCYNSYNVKQPTDLQKSWLSLWEWAKDNGVTSHKQVRDLELLVDKIAGENMKLVRLEK